MLDTGCWILDKRIMIRTFMFFFATEAQRKTIYFFSCANRVVIAFEVL